MRYANRIHNKHDRRISIRALLLMLALMTSIALPTLRPPVSQAQASGTVVGWGNNDLGQLDIPAGLSGVVAISAGGGHSLALMSTFDLDDLIALVNGLNIHQGIQNSLLAKLNAAAGALAADNTATACTKLSDFINECEAQSGKKLSVEQADELIARANEIRDSLGCP